MSSSDFSIRSAAASDARGIAEVHVASWRDTYRGLMPDEVLDGLSVDERALGWARLLDSVNAPAVLVAEDGGRIVGFATTGDPQEDPDRDEGVGELHAIYLAPEAKGRGIGRALMERAEADLAGAGYREAMLWVVEANTATRRFYEIAGWSHDGGHKTVCQGVPAPSVRYRKTF